ncbi:ATP-dependent helicase HrpB [Asticcacaulis biprosthecium C19]|uniref:ATP-dependent helicase HrpB n=1 Tax=Asticcacaulis biprosthecium C19 TaxID=715226 RepID=F4QR20_9CAUL|nr:ATP-dependent helicase HrpB [Asticcacaulis biprosthecium]EGF90657.1 ATP-dependent helicase HrpB [Asticcacaulis biprosthecium C19]
MLPVEEIFPDLKAFLGDKTTAVIIAPPGAGKTTGVPLALLNEPWLQGQSIVLLEPRRLAARAAAARMAETLKEPVGQTVGFRVRGESKMSARTRIEVVTEGIFSRRILDDPGLDGVGCVIFDEFHERSLDADLGLAFARDSQTLLREDLRLLIMSATLDGERILDLLPGARSFQSLGRTFPITTHYLGRDQARMMEADLAKHVARLSQKLRPEKAETLLVFLPGQGEIHRVARFIEEAGVAPEIEIHKLFGAMDFRDQARVLGRNAAGHPKIVLASAIAETSLTLDKVSMVVDCGLSRLGRFDPARGVTRFVTERVSKASADQRRGRAGRTQAGDAYRLWDEEQDRSLIPFAKPEILETDLSQLALSLRLWGAKSTEGLTLLDHPPKPAMAEAVKLLQALGGLDGQGEITPHGRRMAQLPMAPRLANMLLKAAENGAAEAGANLAVLLSENGLGGKATDLDLRLEGLARDRTPKVVQARQLAQGWARQAQALVQPNQKLTRQISHLLLAEAFPERIAKARGKPGEFLMANGRGVYVDEHDPLARQTYVAVGDIGGGKDRDRILLGAGLTEQDMLTLFGDRLERTTVLDKASGRFRAFDQTRLGAVIMSSRPLDKIPSELLLHAEAQEIQAKGLKALNLSEGAQAFRARVGFVRKQDESWPDLSDDALLASLETWLGPYAAGKSMLSLSSQQTYDALKAIVPHEQLRSLDKLAPESLRMPTGSNMWIDYEAEGGPRVEVRVQELYGTTVHPTVGPQKTPITLALLSPAHRPIQITRDLPAFWNGSWSEVRSDMKGRYPRHVWPENPREADPTTRAKPRGT